MEPGRHLELVPDTWTKVPEPALTAAFPVTLPPLDLSDRSEGYLRRQLVLDMMLVSSLRLPGPLCLVTGI